MHAQAPLCFLFPVPAGPSFCAAAAPLRAFEPVPLSAGAFLPDLAPLAALLGDLHAMPLHSKQSQRQPVAPGHVCDACRDSALVRQASLGSSLLPLLLFVQLLAHLQGQQVAAQQPVQHQRIFETLQAIPGLK